jgi:hypothetical protein
MLENLIATRHGQPLIAIERAARKELKVGSTVTFGVKDPITCKVMKLEGQIAHGCGPYLNGHYLLHAVLKYPNGRVHAVPCRSIRQSQISE